MLPFNRHKMNARYPFCFLKLLNLLTSKDVSVAEVSRQDRRHVAEQHVNADEVEQSLVVDARQALDRALLTNPLDQDPPRNGRETPGQRAAS